MEAISFPELCPDCKDRCPYPLDELTFWGSSCVYPETKGIMVGVYLCTACYEKCIPYKESVRKSDKVVIRDNFMDRYYRVQEVQKILNCKRKDIYRLENEHLLTVRWHPHTGYKLYYKDEVDSLLEQVFE